MRSFNSFHVVNQWRLWAIRAGIALIMTGGAALRPSSVRASQPLAPIGYVWGQILVPSSLVGEDRGNELFLVGGQGDLEWRGGSSRVRPSLFAEAYYSRDTKRLDWNNEFTLGLGAQVRITPASGIQFIAGAQYQRDRREISKRTNYGPQGFAGWDVRWPADAGRVQAIQEGKRFTVITQGSLRYPSSLREEERQSGLAMGAVQFAYDLMAAPHKGLALTLFQATTVKGDTKRIDYYNLISPAAGVELRYFLTPTTSIEIGGKIQSETRFVTGKTRVGPSFFVSLVTWRW
jgi:hypothetical protein